MPISPARFPSIGASVPRVDGRLKVTGGARYGSDAVRANAAYACLATSAIARGRIVDIDERAARQLPEVLDILTFKTMAGAIEPGATLSVGGYMGSSIAPLASDRIYHSGQIVGVVVAESFEAATDAARRLIVRYAEEMPAAGFDAAGAETVAGAKASKTHDDPAVGDAEGAFAAADVKVDASYSTPTQHHNPIELFTTTCDWDGEDLTVWESSQNVNGFRHGLAKQLRMSPDRIRIVSLYAGGAFGSRGSLTQRTALIALAAKRLGRPVKLVPTRADGFTIATYRAETRHNFRLAASRDGRLQALIHEGFEVTSRPDPYMVSGTDASTRLYACPNIASKVSIVHADRSTPGFMRAPPELPYLFPLESAMDELAVALDVDPIALRRVNDTRNEPIKGLPYTSRSLMQCFDAGAQAFDWGRRKGARGWTDGDWAVGVGCASTMYPTQMGAATARVTVDPSSAVKVQTAGHEIGNGAYTVIAMVAAESLGLPIEGVTVELGDSDLPPAPGAGGSNSTASVCNVVAKACEEIRLKIATAAVQPGAPFAGADLAGLTFADGMLRDGSGGSEPLKEAIARAAPGAIEVYAENVPHGAEPGSVAKLYQGQMGLTGGAHMKDRIQFAFGAQFVELRVHMRTREIRCSRLVGAFAAGRIINERTARSQLMGGLIWGLSSALHEATEIDRRTARFTNMDLAEYLIPVNADVGIVEVVFVPEDDREVNPLGIKGLGELGNVGVNAAVANALFHATGVRVRDLPIRLEQLLEPRAA